VFAEVPGASCVTIARLGLEEKAGFDRLCYRLGRRMPLEVSWCTARRCAWFGVALVLLAVALLFPVSGAAGVAFLALLALAGVGLARALPRQRITLPGWLHDGVVLGVLLLASVQLFAGPWRASGYRLYDWGPHHANLAHLVTALQRGDVPRWVQSVSTGDSPYELYAFFPYYLAARVAIWTGTSDLTLVLVRSGIVAHVLAALGAGLLTRRVVAWPWAILIGLASLYDMGSVWGGGAGGAIAMGVTHSALSNAVWPFALMAVMAALSRPRLATSVCIWTVVALAIVCHPLALVSAAATMGALVLVAALARDVPRYRALFAFVHVGLGVALAAFVWAPLNDRLLLYGVHFAEGGRSAWSWFAHVMNQPIPETTMAPLVYAGYVGVLVGALSRKARPTLVACFAAILLAGLIDQLYLLLRLVPSLEMARVQSVRLASVAKVGIYVCGAYLMDTALRAVRSAHSARTSLALGALLVLAGAAVTRAGLPFFDRHAVELRSFAQLRVDDPSGFAALIEWAREQHRAQGPDRYARLLDEDERRSYAVSHVNAASGLPTLWAGATSLLFLRERMEDTSADSLRRFNVRWVMRRDRSPSLGSVASERRFGQYYVRELSDWDGRFARVERGRGEVTVTRLEDELVEVELTGTNAPALVALGTGYYPRWQASHDVRGSVPVYALPAIEGGKLSVVAAWLPPGRSSFRPTGSLESDAKGRVISVFALLLACALCGAWRVPKARAGVLRAVARVRRWLDEHHRLLLLSAGALALLALLTAGIRASRAPARALQLGNGLRSAARVEARRANGTWESCTYSALYGAHRCAGAVLVQDAISKLLNDAPPSTPFAVPVITVSTTERPVRVRVQLDVRLAGEYWAATNGAANVSLSVSGEADTTLSGQQLQLLYAEASASREVTLSAEVPAQQTLELALVRRDQLDPDRGYPEAPESSPFD
jgi:hypothetical protein